MSRAVFTSNDNKISRGFGRRKSQQIECSKLRSTCKHNAGEPSAAPLGQRISLPRTARDLVHEGPFHIGWLSEDFDFNA